MECRGEDLCPSQFCSGRFTFLRRRVCFRQNVKRKCEHYILVSDRSLLWDCVSVVGKKLCTPIDLVLLIANTQFRTIFFFQGLTGMYRGYLSTVVREIPFSLIQFPLWEYLKVHLNRFVNTDQQYLSVFRKLKRSMCAQKTVFF